MSTTYALWLVAHPEGNFGGECKSLIMTGPLEAVCGYATANEPSNEPIVQNHRVLGPLLVAPTWKIEHVLSFEELDVVRADETKAVR